MICLMALGQSDSLTQPCNIRICMLPDFSAIFHLCHRIPSLFCDLETTIFKYLWRDTSHILRTVVLIHNIKYFP